MSQEIPQRWYDEDWHETSNTLDMTCGACEREFSATLNVRWVKARRVWEVYATCPNPECGATVNEDEWTTDRLRRFEQGESV